MSSQYLAVTWAMPTRPTLSRCASSSESPASSLTAWLTIVGALALGAVKPVAHGRLVAQVRLEHQPVGLALAAYVLEVGTEGGGHPLLGIGVRAERIAHRLQQGVHALVEQGQVELELAGEMLVEHGLADAGAFGDLIHRGG